MGVTARSWPPVRRMTSSASASARSGGPGRRIQATQSLAVGFRQRKEVRRLRSVDVRPTRRWAAAHERRRVRVVAKSKRVPEFVGDDVADDVGHRERFELGALDCDEAAVADARAERDELCAGEADKKISSEAVEWRRMLAKPSASEHPAGEPACCHAGEGLQLSVRELAYDAVDHAEPKPGA